MAKRTNRAAAPKANHTTPRTDLSICLLLLILTLAVYSRAVHFDFVNYDDPEYVTGNIHVRQGLTWAGVEWAFTSYNAANWSPLTWISHMADVQLFGMDSGWHHATSVILHAAAAMLLFAAIKRLTGARWPSALVAFLFALHPLHVESVAWVAERKDVLCALFWFLALWCYASYVARPGPVRYALVLIAYCLGLMAKPMIVTLPFLLLLLDYWPLRRPLRAAVVWEKAPFILLAAVAALVTMLAQEQGRAVRSLGSIPLALRVGNALVSYVAYIARMFWPVNLAVLYPLPAALPVWLVAASAIVLLTVTAVVVRRRRSQPYLVTGWFWYLSTLVPVIGLVQVGQQASADRYTYVPLTGLAIMLAWGAAELVERRPRVHAAIVPAAVAACCACVALTWNQESYWTDSEALFRHTIEVTSGNYIARTNLASFYLTHGRNADAAEQLREGLRTRSYPEAHIGLAFVLNRLGQPGEAEKEYRAALELQPANQEALSGYGAMLAAQGRTEEAQQQFSALIQAIGPHPETPDEHYELGRALLALEKEGEARTQFEETVREQPDHVDARQALGVVLLSEGRFDEAIAQLSEALRIKPDLESTQYAGTGAPGAGKVP